MRPVLLAVLAAVVSGCAATHAVAPGDDWAALNQRLAGRDAVVTLTDGTAYAAAALRVGPDTTTWVDPASQALLAIPTWAIAEVERRDRARTLRRAVRLGATGGAAVGGALGVAAGAETGGCLILCGNAPPSVGDRVEAAVLFGAGGAAVGVIYGTLYGALAGVVVDAAERFVFEVPPGGGAIAVRSERR